MGNKRKREEAQVSRLVSKLVQTGNKSAVPTRLKAKVTTLRNNQPHGGRGKGRG